MEEDQGRRDAQLLAGQTEEKANPTYWRRRLADRLSAEASLVEHIELAVVLFLNERLDQLGAQVESNESYRSFLRMHDGADDMGYYATKGELELAHKRKWEIQAALAAFAEGHLGKSKEDFEAWLKREPEDLMDRHKEKEATCRLLGDKRRLAICLGNQADILYARGDFDGTLALYREQEQICRELGDPEGLAIALNNQADLLAEKLSRFQEALPLAEEAYRLANEHGLAALAREIKPLLDEVRSKLPS